MYMQKKKKQCILSSYNNVSVCSVLYNIINAHNNWIQYKYDVRYSTFVVTCVCTRPPVLVLIRYIHCDE